MIYSPQRNCTENLYTEVQHYRIHKSTEVSIAHTSSLYNVSSMRPIHPSLQPPVHHLRKFDMANEEKGERKGRGLDPPIISPAHVRLAPHSPCLDHSHQSPQSKLLSYLGPHVAGTGNIKCGEGGGGGWVRSLGSPPSLFVASIEGARSSTRDIS